MEIPYNEYQKLQPLALQILNNINRKERSFVEEINKVVDIIKILYDRRRSTN